MTIEIRSPQLEALILQRMEKAGFQDVEDTLMQALQERPAASGRVGKANTHRTAADLIQALQSSAYRELNIEPCRIRSSSPARGVDF